MVKVRKIIGFFPIPDLRPRRKKESPKINESVSDGITEGLARVGLGSASAVVSPSRPPPAPSAKKSLNIPPVPPLPPLPPLPQVSTDKVLIESAGGLMTAHSEMRTLPGRDQEKTGARTSAQVERLNDELQEEANATLTPGTEDNTEDQWDTESIPPEEMEPFLVYPPSIEPPTSYIVLQLNRLPEYEGGAQARLRRADMVPRDPNHPAGKVQVVCKSIVGWGPTGTGKEGAMTKAAYRTRHPCIVPYLGTTVFSDPLGPINGLSTWIVLPDMPLRDLETWLGKASDETRARNVLDSIAQDVLSGLIHLHQESIVHGDLKTNNIFLWMDGNQMRGKIADFGIARYAVAVDNEREVPFTTHDDVRKSGNTRFLALEHLRDTPSPIPGVVLDHDDYHGDDEVPSVVLSKEKSSDIWAFGMILHHLYSGEVPWPQHSNSREGINLIIDDLKFGLRPRFPGSFAPERGLDFVAWRILRDCWRHERIYRPSVNDIATIWNDPRSREIDMPLEPVPMGAVGWHDLSASIKPLVTMNRQHRGYFERGAHWRAPSHPRVKILVRLVRPDRTPDGVHKEWLDERFRIELGRWRRVQHEHLQQSYGLCLCDDGMWYAVVPEYRSFSSWYAAARQQAIEGGGEGTPVPNKLLYKLLLDIAYALQFLHAQVPPIVHGDVTIDNIICPIRVEGQPVEKSVSIQACLGGYDHMRNAPAGDVSGELRQYGAVVRRVFHEKYGTENGATLFEPDLPEFIAEIITKCEAGATGAMDGVVAALSQNLLPRRRAK